MAATTVNGLFADDLTVAIDEQGSGRPVLLLHGGGGPQTVAGLSAALSDEFNVISPTHPGFNLTPRPDWYDGVDDIALTYLELFDQRDLHDVLVIGSSIGGWIAAEMAVREHHRISGTPHPSETPASSSFPKPVTSPTSNNPNAFYTASGSSPPKPATPPCRTASNQS